MIIKREVSPAQQERLTKLIEECAEVIKVATKIQRFGWDAYDASLERPDCPTPTNNDDLESELGGLEAVVTLMSERGDLDPIKVTQAAVRHYPKMVKWMRRQ